MHLKVLEIGHFLQSGFPGPLDHLYLQFTPETKVQDIKHVISRGVGKCVTMDA